MKRGIRKCQEIIFGKYLNSETDISSWRGNAGNAYFDNSDSVTWSQEALIQILIKMNNVKVP